MRGYRRYEHVLIPCGEAGLADKLIDIHANWRLSYYLFRRNTRLAADSLSDTRRSHQGRDVHDESQPDKSGQSD